jgi:hypothetical protein
VSRGRAYAFVGGIILFIVAMSLWLAGCRDLDGTGTQIVEASSTSMPPEQTTTSEAPATTETTAAAFVEVTMETGTDPCYIVSAFTSGGTDYVQVDFIQVSWTYEFGRWNDNLQNTNPKLRTFILPEDAKFVWPASLDASPGDYESRSAPRTFAGLLSIPGLAPDYYEFYEANQFNWIGYGFWEIKVADGRVVSLTAVTEPPND